MSPSRRVAIKRTLLVLAAGFAGIGITGETAIVVQRKNATPPYICRLGKISCRRNEDCCSGNCAGAEREQGRCACLPGEVDCGHACCYHGSACSAEGRCVAGLTSAGTPVG